MSGAWRSLAGWIALAAVLAALPLALRSGAALSTASLAGIAIVFALSYNMLLGQTGMLSFGHAVYYGIGAYGAVHGMNMIVAARAPLPLPLVPLLGGLSGLGFAAVFGWVSTRRGGTAFAMISLGLAELVGSSSLILRSFFGGEEGVTTDRTRLPRLFDLGFGPQIQVYYLVAFWCLAATALMYGITRTPFGRMCNAVRDNAARVPYAGVDPHVLRFMAFCLSGFFAGVAGGLAAINFEIANSAYFGAAQSGTVLLATFVGGAGHFAGPAAGAILVTCLQTLLGDVTDVWQLYFGLMFMAAVMYLPGGIASLWTMQIPLWRAGRLARVLPWYGLAALPAVAAFAGFAGIVEMTARLTLRRAEGPAMSLAGLGFRADAALSWIVALACLGGGALLCRLAWPAAAAARDRALAP